MSERSAELERPWLFAAILALVGVLLAVLDMPSTHGHGCRPIRVTGRLVWGPSQEPLAGARVLTVSRYDLEHAWDPEEAWEWVEVFDAERKKAVERGEGDDLRLGIGFCDNAGARSGADGRVEMMLGLPTMTVSSPLFDWTDVEDPEDEVAALWVAPEGREPVLVRIEEADWRQTDDGGADGIWGTHDLGTVVVPERAP